MEYLVIPLKGYLALTVVPPFKSATVIFLSEGDDVKSGPIGEDFSPTTQPLVTRVYHLTYNSVIHQTVTENKRVVKPQLDTRVYHLAYNGVINQTVSENEKGFSSDL